MDHKVLAQMTQEEKTDEILTYLRLFADMLEAASSNPMLAMMVPGGIPKIGA